MLPRTVEGIDSPSCARHALTPLSNWHGEEEEEVVVEEVMEEEVEEERRK